MKKRAVLLTILVSVFVFGACNSQPPIVKVTPTPTPTPAITNTTPIPAEDWVYYYDVDVDGYPYYPEKHKKHRKGSRRWYPYGHSKYDGSYMLPTMPTLKTKEKLEDLPKVRYSRSKPNMFEDVDSTASATSSSTVVYANTPVKVKNNSTDFRKIPSTTYSSSTTYPSSTPYRSSSYPSASSTPYRSSSYPSASSTPYRSSTYPSTSSTPYRSSTYPSTSSTPYRSSSTTIRTRRR